MDNDENASIRCYYTDIERCVMVFEDLGTGNFVHTDKANGFDIAHLKLNLQLLAKWHAATAVLLLKVMCFQGK